MEVNSIHWMIIMRRVRSHSVSILIVILSASDSN